MQAGLTRAGLMRAGLMRAGLVRTELIPVVDNIGARVPGQARTQDESRGKHPGKPEDGQRDDQLHMVVQVRPAIELVQRVQSLVPRLAQSHASLCGGLAPIEQFLRKR
jgi:hypothetical protein